MTRKLLAMLSLLLLFLCPAFAESAPGIRLESDVRSFQDNPLIVSCKESGMLTVTVEDKLNTYRSWTLDAQVGENHIAWDGLGDHQEPMPQGQYRVCAVLKTDTGETQEASAAFELKRSRQALRFALSSSDTLYADTRWYIEYRLVRAGRMTIEFYRAEDMNTLLETRRRDATNEVCTYTWDGTLNGEAVEPGDYVLRLYAFDNPDYRQDVLVHVAGENSPMLPVGLTGAIMPTDDMDDAAIWKLMMAPSVVVAPSSAAKHTHYNIYAAADKNSKVLGTLHCNTQAVEVMDITESGWCRIGAWNHEDGSYTVGYVPKNRLTVVQPRTQYGILIDKRDQTMTIFERGKRIWQMKISTGLMAKDKLIRETAAGAFITAEHMEDFSDSGFTYSYPIRYDGGNLIHQLGWKRVGGKLDFSEQTPYLGHKASHGCTRIEGCTGDGEINAYWIYTHIPAGTRIMIVDDPKQRLLEMASANAGTDPYRALTVVASPTDLASGEDELLLTFGGDVVLGTREKWQSAQNALPAVLAREGYDYPFRNLVSIFKKDDMTLLNLECVLKADSSGEDKEKLYRFRGLPEYTEVLWRAGVDQVNIANNHVIDYGTKGRETTRAALWAANIPSSGYGQLYIWEKNGHRIGFGGCRETIWRQDTSIIHREVEQLRQLGCEVVIYTCHWGTEYSPAHDSELQKAMAQSAIDAGVDIVVGGHPHVVQGIEYRNGTLILYSLGNLMFGGTHDMTTFDAMLAQVRLRFGANGYEGATLSLLPVLTSSSAPVNDFCPILATGQDAQRILAKVQADSDIAVADNMFFPAK